MLAVDDVLGDARAAEHIYLPGFVDPGELPLPILGPGGESAVLAYAQALYDRDHGDVGVEMHEDLVEEPFSAVGGDAAYDEVRARDGFLPVLELVV